MIPDVGAGQRLEGLARRPQDPCRATFSPATTGTAPSCRTGSDPRGMEARAPLRVAALVSAATLMLICGAAEDASSADVTGAAPGPPTAALRPPVSPVAVIEGVDLPESPWLSGHRGVDLATSPGADVLSPTAGIVTYAGTVAGRGVVSVSVAGTGLRTTMEPVTASVRVGDTVQQGEVVGQVQAAVVEAGVGHCAPAACLHWGLRSGDTYLDPLDWTVGWGPIRLKRAT